ncbi:MAG: DUF5995 family protein [Chloroflexota bacterium]|nr:DUF5995 family protein [Chloroflexota bacterium]
MKVQSIDDVIDELGTIVTLCRAENSRLAFFPALYRKTTIRVKEGIACGRFEDGQRMESLDVVFANRYLEAFKQLRRGEQPTKSWAYAFELADASHPLIVQHLLLGMNAHINLDLGIAAVETSPAGELSTLRRDFFEINNILAELLGEVQSDLGELSPLMRLLDGLLGPADEALSNFSIRKAREAAWERAETLTGLQTEAVPDKIEDFDQEVADFAQVICPRDGLLVSVMAMVRSAESDDVRAITDILL